MAKRLPPSPGGGLWAQNGSACHDVNGPPPLFAYPAPEAAARQMAPLRVYGRAAGCGTLSVVTRALHMQPYMANETRP